MSRGDSSGTTWPSSLIIHLDPGGMIPEELLAGNRDNAPNMLERSSPVQLCALEAVLPVVLLP